MAERIIRLGKKWEAEHQMWEERERRNEAELKAKEMELLASDKKRMGKLRNNGGHVEKGARKGEMDLDNFLKKERQLMLTRLRPKDKKFVPFTKDLRVVDAKFVHYSTVHNFLHEKKTTFYQSFFCRRRMSEVSIQKLKLIVAKVRAPNTIDGDMTESSSDVGEISTTAANEDSNEIDLRSKRKNTKVNANRKVS